MKSKSKVLISGGSRGIGKSTALILKASGYEVFAPSSQELDVGSDESVESFFEKNGNGFDVLISNAGIFISKECSKQSITDWNNVINVNLTGAFRLSKKILPYMENQNQGKIIFVSSLSATMGEAYASAYSASKAGLLGLCKSLALEYGKYGITVNAICPGWIRTDMALDILDTAEKQKEALGSVLQERFIEPEEVGELIKYLISPVAKAITGELINIGAGINL